jgi:hypothetical protein
MIPGVIGSGLDRRYRVRLRVTSGTVSSDLSSFPVSVNLAELPPEFWDHLSYRDGRDIRVKTSGGSDLPFDIVRIDPESESGWLVYKQSLTAAADTDAYLHYGDRSLGAVAVDAANGRNAVWADYHRVFAMGDSFDDRTGNGDALTVNGSLVETFDLVSTSANIGVHQGVASDGYFYYVVDTNGLKKYDLSWSLIATNNNPVGAVPGTNHCGDIEVVAGILYVPIESYTDITTFGAQHIARFLSEDLSFIDAIDVSAQAHEVASICYNRTDQLLYVASYADGSKLWKYAPDDLSYVGSLNLSSTIPYIQGVTCWRGAFWVNSDSPDATIRVELDGTVRGRVWSVSGVYEGIGHTEDALLVLEDTTGSSDGVVHRIQPRDVVLGGGLYVGGTDSYLIATGVTRYTTWTIGATASLASKGQNRAIVNYTENGVSSLSIRPSLAYRNSSDRWGIWNNTDSWLLGSASPTIGQRYRLNMVHDGTTVRRLYVDGSLDATDNTISARPTATANCLYIGIEDAAQAEDHDGEIGLVYLRSGVLSTDWLAAEAESLAPGSPTFCTIGTEELL